MQLIYNSLISFYTLTIYFIFVMFLILKNVNYIISITCKFDKKVIYIIKKKLNRYLISYHTFKTIKIK